ncbi:unnamed protein product [Cunninghamella echinulata]
MYYYHFHLALYTLNPINLPTTIFDKLPPYLIPKETIDLIDTYYQQITYIIKDRPDKNLSTKQQEQLHLFKNQTDKSLKPNVPPTPAYEYQKNTTATATSSSTSTAVTINNNSNNNTDDLLHRSNTTTLNNNTSNYINFSFANDDFRLGPIDIETIQKEKKNNKKKNNSKSKHGTTTSAVTASTTVSIGQHSKIGYGILHLYRDENPVHEDLMPDMLSAINNNGELGTIVCTLSVPSYMTTHDFLTFVKPFDHTIEQYKFIRDASPNKYMVVMKFKDVESAYTYHRKFNGRQFHGMEPELCHIVFLSSISWDINLIPQNSDDDDSNNNEYNDGSNKKKTIQYPMLKDTLQAERNRNLKPCTIELPTCPVCLERMDENITGLLGFTCQHSFDCGCLGKWGHGNCYVCQFSEKPVLEGSGRDIALSMDNTDKLVPKRNHQGWLLSRHANDDRLCCFACGSTDSLWICMICGHIGCGRYQEAHAYEHYRETNHLYALEIDTQRVWDYVGDGYVHRLIQNTVDGKLVELPGIRDDHSHHLEDGKDRNHQHQHHNNNDNNNDSGSSGSSSTRINNTSAQLALSMVESSSSTKNNSGTVNHQHQHDADNQVKSVWGKIPSSSSIKHKASIDQKDHETDLMQQEKINAMSIEYTNLLTSQLESQRIYYEDQLNALVKQLSSLTAKQNYVQNEIQDEMDQQQILVAQKKEMAHEWELTQTNKNKLEQNCQTWKDKYESARLSWEEEKKETNKLSQQNEELKQILKDKKKMFLELNDEIRDLKFFVEARNKVNDLPELAGGNVGTFQKSNPNKSNKTRRGKKGKR